MSATTDMQEPGPEAGDIDLELAQPSNSVSAGEGVAWIGAGWKLFARSPIMWIIALVILFIIAVVMNFIPILGTLAFQVLSPVFAAGLVVACRAIERGGEFELEHLFAGFKRNFGSLAVVGLIYVGVIIAFMLVFAIIFGFPMVGAFMSGNPEQAAAAMAENWMSMLLAMLVCAALFIPVLAAYWFAPPLVVMHGMAPVAAMKASLMGCLRNIIPMIVWSIVMGVIMMIAVIPFGLGMLVAVPLLITSSYAAYRAIFTTERAEAVATRKVMVG
jgi:uncharacterized membrane protein